MTTPNKIKISAIILTALVICFVVFLIWPLFKEIKENSEKIISQKVALATLEIENENLKEFKSYSEKTKVNLEKLDTLFVDPELPVDFINFLEKIARDCQLSIKITPLAGRLIGEPWPTLRFQISSTSTFPNLLRFLEKLESSIYLIEIQDLNINQLAKAELGDVQTTLSLKVFTK